jgi:glutamate transport system substrate-binding protein
MTSRLRGLVAALTAVITAGVLASCGFGNSPSSVSGKRTLVIGVKKDQPGLGLQSGDGFEGFDVDVARYVARKLGAKPEFVPIVSKEREQAIEHGKVDMVVATYSITPERATKVLFGGPYYLAHQDILVRSDNTSIHTVHDLAHRRLCDVPGSDSFSQVKVEEKIPVFDVQAPDYSGCVKDLLSGTVDAVSTDDLILAGFASQNQGQVKVLNAPFTDEKYGIGISKDDVTGCEDINKAITDMYQDGTGAMLLNKWFHGTGLALDTYVPQFEGCS